MSARIAFFGAENARLLHALSESEVESELHAARAKAATLECEKLRGELDGANEHAKKLRGELDAADTRHGTGVLAATAAAAAAVDSQDQKGASNGVRRDKAPHQLWTELEAARDEASQLRAKLATAITL